MDHTKSLEKWFEDFSERNRNFMLIKKFMRSQPLKLVAIYSINDLIAFKNSKSQTNRIRLFMMELPNNFVFRGKYLSLKGYYTYSLVFEQKVFGTLNIVLPYVEQCSTPISSFSIGQGFEYEWNDEYVSRGDFYITRSYYIVRSTEVRQTILFSGLSTIY